MWFTKWNTNLPAGLFSVVSSLNEYICFIIVTHWLGKGGIMGSMSPCLNHIFSLDFYEFYKEA